MPDAKSFYLKFFSIICVRRINKVKKYVYLLKRVMPRCVTCWAEKAQPCEMKISALPVPQGSLFLRKLVQKIKKTAEISDDVVDQKMPRWPKQRKLPERKFGRSENPSCFCRSARAHPCRHDGYETKPWPQRRCLVGMAKKSGNPRWAYDSYRSFIQMFSDVVMEIDKEKFEHELQAMKDAKGVKLDTDLDADDLKKLVAKYKEIYKKEMGKDFPQDAKEQLLESVTAVFRSWDNPRAIVYRRMNDIPASWGTAVNVQTMVFGNMGDDCGTGVAFTRDPSTGEKRLYGEYLMNAQGEDVVAGIRTPPPITHLQEQMPRYTSSSLR